MFSANITGGGLLLQESRILAEQLLAGRRADELLSVSLAQNLLQKRSPATTQKNGRSDHSSSENYGSTLAGCRRAGR